MTLTGPETWLRLDQEPGGDFQVNKQSGAESLQTESREGLENSYKTQTSLHFSVSNLVIAMFTLISDRLNSIYVTFN